MKTRQKTDQLLKECLAAMGDLQGQLNTLDHVYEEIETNQNILYNIQEMLEAALKPRVGDLSVGVPEKPRVGFGIVLRRCVRRVFGTYGCAPGNDVEKG